MPVFKTSASVAALFAVLLFGFQTNAVAEGFYIGAGIYQTQAQVDSLDETDETPALFLGYNLIDSNVFLLSAEFGYYDLGDYSDHGVTVDADAYTLSAVGTIPLGPFIELFGKVGVAQVSLSVNDDDDDGSEAFYGVGIGIDVLDTLDVYIEYLDFDTEVDSNMIGIGLRLDLL